LRSCRSYGSAFGDAHAPARDDGIVPPGTAVFGDDQIRRQDRPALGRVARIVQQLEIERAIDEHLELQAAAFVLGEGKDVDAAEFEAGQLWHQDEY
jgi:hypothetical protein